MAGQNVLMLTKDDEEVEVEPHDFDTAIQSGLEPALEYVDKDGGVNVVRKSHAKDAEKAGMVQKPLYDAKQEAKKGINVGAGEAAARGFANNATFGFADEIGAAAKHPMGAIKSVAKDLPLVGKYLNDDAGDARDISAYQGERNAYRLADDAAWDQQKLAYGAGAALPAVASIFAPASVAANAAKGTSAAVQALKTGAAQGALTAAGGGTDYDKDVDLTQKDSLKKYLEKVITGGAVGGLSGAGIQKLGEAATKGATKLADKFAYRATGGMTSDMNKLYNKTGDQVGRTLLDEGAIPVFAKRGGDKIKDRIQSKLGEFGEAQDDLLRSLDTIGGGVNVSDIEQKLAKEISDLRSKPGVSNKKMADAIQSELDDFLQTVGKSKPGTQNISPGENLLTGDVADEGNIIGLLDSLGIKRGYDAAGKFENKTDAAAVNAARKIRSAINESIDEGVAKVGGQAQSDAYKAARSKASDFADAAKALNNAKKRQISNKPFGLTDTILASGGLGAGIATMNPATVLPTVAAIGVKKLAESYGDAFAANALNLLQKNGPQEMLKRLSQVVGPQEAERIYMTLTDGK